MSLTASPKQIQESADHSAVFEARRSWSSLVLEKINGNGGLAEETSTASSFSQEAFLERPQELGARVSLSEKILSYEFLRDKESPLKILPSSKKIDFLAEPSPQILQKWEGCVEEVKKETFSAKLYDLQDLQAPDYFCEIYLEEVSEADKELVQPGAVFYWHIFYKEQAGQKSRESRIRFRRLPWSKAQREQAEKDAEKLNRYFQWDSIETSQRQ